jgi:hypothetical protein
VEARDFHEGSGEGATADAAFEIEWEVGLLRDDARLALLILDALKH